MPQWFCWYSRSGFDGQSRTQCGSWNATLEGSSCSTTSRPFTSGDQVAPPSRDSCTPPLDMPTYRCAASRGSTRIEWSFGPSGVPSWGPPIHARYFGSSFRPDTGAHVAPPSSDRKSPWGEVPAYHVSSSLGWPGVSQKV